MASLSLFHLRAIFYGANIGIYFITPKKRRYFFSHRNEFQDHFYPHTMKNAHFSLPLFGREPRTSRSAQALGKREERAAGPTEEQSGTIAEPPLHSFAQRRSDRKRRSKRLRPWALYRLIGELFAYRPHPGRHPRRRKKRGRRNREKALARTRVQHRVSVFRLHPSAVIRWFTTHYR